MEGNTVVDLTSLWMLSKSNIEKPNRDNYMKIWIICAIRSTFDLVLTLMLSCPTLQAGWQLELDAEQPRIFINEFTGRIGVSGSSEINGIGMD